MRYEVTASAEGSDDLGGIRVKAHTARGALGMAEEMAKKGMREIRITSPEGTSQNTEDFRAAVAGHDRRWI